MEKPDKINKFQEWLSNKRAIGLATLAGRLEDLMRVGNASIIGNTKGGEVEELITMYYNHDIMTQDTVEFTNMLNRIINLKHKHSKDTIDQYHIITKQKRKVMTFKDMKVQEIKVKEEGSAFARPRAKIEKNKIKDSKTKIKDSLPLITFAA